LIFCTNYFSLGIILVGFNMVIEIWNKIKFLFSLQLANTESDVWASNNHRMHSHFCNENWRAIPKVKEAGLSLPQWSGIYLIAGKTTPRLLLEN
jgi:hypothetical protein